MRLRVIFTAAFIVLLIIVQSAPSLPADSEPRQIRVYICPPKLPADNRTYEAVFIQLLSAAGLPARAPRKIEVSLSSSNIGVAKVEEKVIITEGETYAVAKVSTTYTVGSTTITVAAPDIGSASTTLTTVGSPPARVAAYIIPPTLPADGRKHMALIVQLQDSSGNPTRAPAGGLKVALFSSNSTVCAVDPYIVIGGGETYAVACLTPNAVGSATITPVAPGLSSIEVSVRVQMPDGKPTKIKIYASPPRLLADGRTHRIIALQLLDAYGRLSRAEGDLKVTLSSSNINVGSVNETALIRAGETYVMVDFNATFNQGSTTIIAAAPDFQKDQVTITTVGFIPTRITTYCALPYIPADGRKHRVLAIQLLDQSGLPAVCLNNIEVTLTSSNERAISVDKSITIPTGTSLVLTEVQSSHIAGSAYVTAQAAGLTSSQVQVSTKLIDSFTLKVKATAHPESAKPGETVHVKIYVAVEGVTPAAGATVKVSSNPKVIFSKIIEEGGGYYSTSFTAPNATSPLTIKITAEASLQNYAGGSGSVEVKVEPKVKLGGVKITVVGADGKPIKGVSVSSISKPSGAPTLTSITDENGIVQFIGIPEGQYTFNVGGGGYTTQTIMVTVDANQIKSVTVTLTAEETLQPWIIMAVAAAAVSVAAIMFFKFLRGKLPSLRKPAKPPEDKGGQQAKQ